MAKRSWVQDPITGKLVPKHEYVRRSGLETAAVQGDIEPFVSPITGKTITSRSLLRAHNAEHGVTDSRDYSDAFLAERSRKRDDEMTGNNPVAKQERRELIMRELEKHGR